MDDQRFDALVRALGNESPRRAMLAGLGAATLGGVLSLFGQEPGQAARKEKNRKRQQSKRRGKPRSSGVRAQAKNGKNKKVRVCHRTGSATNPLVFIEVSENAADAHRKHGDAIGVDLESDPENCGACGNDCGAADACTIPVCEDGECGTAAVNCDDRDACTIDDCDPDSGCTHTRVDCNDNNECTIDNCDPVDGCFHTPVDCDDDNECTIDACDPDSGCTYTAVDCDDDNECTIDDCDPGAGCIHRPVDCDDNDACTVDTCHPATGCSYALRNCDDGNECTQNLCNPATGCFFPPRPGAPCANGNGICNQTGQCIPRQGVCGGPSGGPCICRNRATGQPCPSQGPCPQPNPPFQLACPSDSCLCIA